MEDDCFQKFSVLTPKWRAMNKYLISRWERDSWGEVLMAIVNDNAFAMSSIFFNLPYKKTFNVTLQNTLEQSFTINRFLYPNTGLLIVSSCKNCVNCYINTFVFKIENIELAVILHVFSAIICQNAWINNDQLIIQYDYRQLDKVSCFCSSSIRLGQFYCPLIKSNSLSLSEQKGSLLKGQGGRVSPLLEHNLLPSREGIRFP